MRETGRRDSSYAAALAWPQFRALLAASVAAIGGMVISTVVLTVLIYERTRSPVLSASVFALGFLPYLISGTVLSAVADRVPPRRLLASCYAGSAALTTAMAIPGLPAGVLLALLTAVGLLGGLASPAQAALVRSAVPEAAYVPARSLLRVAAQAAQIGGNPVGGLLIAAVSPAGAFLAAAAAFAATCALARFGLAPHPVSTAAGRGALLGDSLRGVRDVLSRPVLRRLLLLGWLVPLFSVAPEALAAPYVTSQHGSPVVIGWWLAAMPAGLITGELLGVRFLTPPRQRQLTGLAAAAGFVPYLVFFASPPAAAAVALLAVAGAGGLYSLGLDALVRQAAPGHLFTRAMAVSTAGLLTTQAIGFPLAGALAAIAGPGAAITVAGLCGIAAAVALRPAKPAAAPASPSPPQWRTGTS